MITMKYGYIIVIGFCLMVLFQSCKLSDDEIREGKWKLSDVVVGNPETSIAWANNLDVLIFNDSTYYLLLNDTIYRYGMPYAEIIEKTKGASTSIKIVLIGSQDTLRYVKK